MKRVVVTGIGIYSCLGKNLEEVRHSLYHGKSGIGIDPVRQQIGYRSPLTGILPDPNLKDLLHRRLRNNLGQEGEYAFMATHEALRMARIDEAFFDTHEVGILYGNDSTGKGTVEGWDRMREKKDSTLLGSHAIFQQMNSTVTMNLSTIFKIKGINLTISAACASGSHAIGLGFFFIRNGLQNCIICGGAQEVNPIAMASFDGLSAFSIRTDEPTKASRPFDKNRDGLVPSGGGATVILEELEFAQKRGANILAEVIGYGFSSNGGHISQPSVDGPARSLAMSLRDANVQPADIQYINAHATSTPIGDAHEAKAIHEVFGDKCPWVSSTKSMTGHECWMAGASEVVYSLLMMQNGFIAPNINFEEPDDDTRLIRVTPETIETELNMVLSNSFGFGGTNSSLILKKYKP